MPAAGPAPERSSNLSLLRCLAHPCSQNEDQGLRRRNERERTVSSGSLWGCFFSPFNFGVCSCRCSGASLPSSNRLEEAVVGSSLFSLHLHLHVPAAPRAAPEDHSPGYEQGRRCLIHPGRSHLVLPRVGDFTVSKRTVIL